MALKLSLSYYPFPTLSALVYDKDCISEAQGTPTGAVPRTHCKEK